MNYFSFSKDYKHYILFGIVMTFMSSFGQTFFISLYVPYFRETFSLTNAEFGSMYSIATVLSAVTLIYTGTLIDKMKLKYYVSGILAAAIVFTFTMSIAWSVPVFFIALFGMRHTYQALCSHTAQTTMARYFAINRGKSLSLTNLGYPIGEALLPILFAILISSIGWRLGMGIIPVFLILLIVPSLWFLLKQIPDDPKETLKSEGADLESVSESVWTRRMVLKDKRFYVILPAFIASPFLLTGFFLYQLDLAAYKGWSVELIAAAFILFALGRIVFSLISGPMIDRFSARKMFPFVFIPITAGILIMSSASNIFIPFIYMLLLGVSEGFTGSVKSALWAEIYGIKALGTVRSLMAFIVILSTAFSPFLFGWLLDSGITFNQIARVSVLYLIVAMFLASGIRNAKSA